MKKLMMAVTIVMVITSSAIAIPCVVEHIDSGVAVVKIINSRTPLPEGAVYPVPAGVRGNETDYHFLDGSLIEKTEAEKEAYSNAVVLAEAEAEAQRQANKSDKLKEVENNFMLLCQSVTQAPEPVLLSFAELHAIGATITDQETKVELMLSFLSLDAEAKTVSKNNEWWFDCAWHPEVVD